VTELNNLTVPSRENQLKILTLLLCSLNYSPISNEGDFFLNLPNPSGSTSPGVYSASNRNEYQKHKNNVSRE
jgi:hypothetical protein